MYIYISLYIHVYIHMCIYKASKTCHYFLETRTRKIGIHVRYIYKDIFVCKCKSVFVYICMYMFVCVYIYI